MKAMTTNNEKPVGLDLTNLKAQVPDFTPRRYLVYGNSMAGKTYFAQHFPKPLILSTDGNGVKNVAPTIDIRGWSEVSDDDRRLALEHGRNVASMTEVLGQLQSVPKAALPFETIVIDLIDDLTPMLQRHALARFLKDPTYRTYWSQATEFHPGLGFGRMSILYNTEYSRMLSILKSLDLNVVFISYAVDYTDNHTKKECTKPALGRKDCDKVQGVCDMTIHLNRNSNNVYTSLVEAKRSSRGYKREEVSPAIAKVIDECNVQNFWALR